MPYSDVTVYVTFKQTDNVWDDGLYDLTCSIDPWRRRHRHVHRRQWTRHLLRRTRARA